MLFYVAALSEDEEYRDKPAFGSHVTASRGGAYLIPATGNGRIGE